MSVLLDRNVPLCTRYLCALFEAGRAIRAQWAQA